MLEAMKNLRDEMLSFHQKPSESGVDKTFDFAQAKPMPGTSVQSDPPLTSNPTPSKHSDVQPMDLEPYSLALPPKFSQPQPDSDHSERVCDSEYYQVRPRHKKDSDRRKHKLKLKRHFSVVGIGR